MVNVETKDGDGAPWRYGERGRDQTTVGVVEVVENVTGSCAVGTVNGCEVGTSDVEVYAVVY